MNISIANAIALDTSTLIKHKASEEQIAAMRQATVGAYIRPDVPPQTDYAKVMVGNKVVGTISNSGGGTKQQCPGQSNTPYSE